MVTFIIPTSGKTLQEMIVATIRDFFCNNGFVDSLVQMLWRHGSLRIFGAFVTV